MKILIFVPCWQRPEIFEEMASRLKFPAWVDPVKMAIVSPEDPYADKLHRIASREGFFVHYENNFPVGRKMNDSLKYALFINKQWQYLMGINSDDLLDIDYWEQVKPYLEKGYPMVGMDSIIAYDMANKRGMKLTLNEDTSSGGCLFWGGGRFISRDAIERTISKLGYVYQDDLNSGLDTSSQNNIFQNVTFQLPPKVIHGCYLLDMKTETNINPYHSMRYVPHTKPTEEEINKYFLA